MKKPPGDIIILHKCTKNYDQMMYGSWDMVRDRCNWYFSFWAIFCIFTPLTAQKIKSLKKWKKLLEISSFYICAPKIKIRWCTVPEICCTTDRWTDGRTEKVTYEVGAPPKKWDENQSIFFCMWQVHFNTWDLTTWKCVISMYTYIYVKIRYIAAQEVRFLEFTFQILEKFCDRHIFSLFLTKHL